MGKEEKLTPEGSSAIEQARSDVRKAKADFLEASEELDPFKLVKDKPILSAGGAFLLGYSLTALSRRLALVQFIPLLLQVTESASRILADFRKH